MTIHVCPAQPELPAGQCADELIAWPYYMSAAQPPRCRNGKPQSTLR